MDFQQWSAEYLREAEQLRLHLLPVRQRLQQVGIAPEESRELTARARILYQMYLECRETGLLLQRRA